MIGAVLIKPIVTEKSMRLAEKGWYTFEVALESDKYSITEAVEKQFKVDVKAIKTMRMHGKPKRIGKRRTEVATSDRKKALVKLGEKQKIELFNFTESENK